MNLFGAMPGGDPAHAIVLYAEAADVDSVMIAGKFVKRGGQLGYPADKLARLRDDILASRERIMHEAGYQYQRVEKGPMPEKFA
jgi:cytosine/adenosine deaminase-related metal-dependent hydrolase